MNLTVEQFNQQIPVGTEVLYFPNGDGLPIVTTRIQSEATQELGTEVVNIEFLDSNNTHRTVGFAHIETCSQNQFDKIIKILDVRVAV